MISVLIPTFNRVDQLRECINSLKKQTLESQEYEIIIVDDGSSDQTPELGQSFSVSSEGHIRYFRQTNQGPAAARNFGIQNAKGEVVAFIDDDCRAERNWLEELVKGYSDPKVGGTGGRIISPLKETLADRYCFHVGLLETPKMKEDRVEYVITANASFRKKAVLEIGGFDEHFVFPGGEDPDISYRLTQSGYRLIYNPFAIVNHYHPRSLNTLRKTFFNYGMGWAILLSKEKKGLPTVVYHFLSITLVFLLAIKNTPGYFKAVGGLQGLAFGFFDFYIRAVYRIGLVFGYVRYRRILAQKGDLRL